MGRCDARRAGVQFKLVVDGLKDLALVQVALGAVLVELVRRGASPGRRFYGIVRLSDPNAEARRSIGRTLSTAGASV